MERVAEGFRDHGEMVKLARRLARKLTVDEALEYRDVSRRNGRYDARAAGRFVWDLLETGGIGPKDELGGGTESEVEELIWDKLERLLAKYDREEASSRGEYVVGQRYKWESLRVAKVDYWTGEEPWLRPYASVWFDGDGFQVVTTLAGRLAEGEGVRVGQRWDVAGGVDKVRGASFMYRGPD